MGHIYVRNKIQARMIYFGWKRKDKVQMKDRYVAVISACSVLMNERNNLIWCTDNFYISTVTLSVRRREGNVLSHYPSEAP